MNTQPLTLDELDVLGRLLERIILTSEAPNRVPVEAMNSLVQWLDREVGVLELQRELDEQGRLHEWRAAVGVAS